MMRCGQSILLFCTLTFGLLAQATPPAPNDFAYGMKVETEGQASIWKIRLPEDVYRKATRPDLGDIRVFDASGQIVPHMLGRPEGMIKEPPAPISLPIFPLYQSDEKDSVGQTVRIITDDTGTIVRALRETISTHDDGFISAYLLDATKIQHQPDKLTLSWESDKETGFSSTVNVDVSDDLSAWRPLVSDATLADLHFDGQKLSHREMVIPVRSYKYLRISWPIALRDVSLREVIASFPSGKHPPQRQWISIIGVKNPEQPISFDFDTHGNWPVNQARILFSSQNVLINGELASRSAKNISWTRKYRGLFYKLVQDNGTQLISAPISFATTSDRYWRLEEVDDGNVLNRYSPVLELAWTPHILTFVAQGNPPYMIAYGSTSVGLQRQAMDEMMLTIHGKQQKVSVKTAATSQSFTLGGSEKLVAPPEPLPWRVWLLWTVLIAGVALLGWMVWRLSREMGKPPNPQD